MRVFTFGKINKHLDMSSSEVGAVKKLHNKIKVKLFSGKQKENKRFHLLFNCMCS